MSDEERLKNFSEALNTLAKTWGVSLRPKIVPQVIETAGGQRLEAVGQIAIEALKDWTPPDASE